MDTSTTRRKRASAPISEPPTESSSAQDQAAEAILVRAFARTDNVALGIAVGVVVGALVALATVIPLARDGEIAGVLSRLDRFFIGYSVSRVGILVGLAYGFGAGFAAGWLASATRNAALRIYLACLRLDADLGSVNDIIEHAND